VGPEFGRHDHQHRLVGREQRLRLGERQGARADELEIARRCGRDRAIDLVAAKFEPVLTRQIVAIPALIGFADLRVGRGDFGGDRVDLRVDVAPLVE